ncbi:MAG TPA: hydroxyethylthiazole kinase [Gammaproteobacteria bacterium]|nr:hydroxyethylthiazole kinase [Gammaproteobacteria bacterium]
MSQDDPAARFWHCSEQVRSAAPLVQNITNLVMQHDTAAAIAAVGGTQMTLHGIEEVREITSVASALAVNPGTLNEAWMGCAREAVAVARQRRIPWVLDPLAVGLSRYRTDAITELLSLGPTVVKANASELLVLAGAEAAGRAADSVHSVEQAAAPARELASRHRCVVVVTGSEDLIADGKRAMRVSNGARLMGRMIGSGCMLTSVMACFLALGNDPLEAAAAAVAHFTIAGELAAERAEGPGSLKPRLIDALYNLDREQFCERLRVQSTGHV